MAFIIGRWAHGAESINKAAQQLDIHKVAPSALSWCSTGGLILKDAEYFPVFTEIHGSLDTLSREKKQIPCLGASVQHGNLTHVDSVWSSVLNLLTNTCNAVSSFRTD